MSHMLDADEKECEFCGDDIGPGDSLMVVWTGEVRGDGSWDGQSRTVAHATCARLEDDTPEEYATIENTRTGVVHLARWTGSGFTSLCRTVADDREYEEAERVNVSGIDDEALCRTCGRLA